MDCFPLGRMVERMNFLLRPESAYERPISYLKDFGCIRPSKYIEIHATGSVSICCFTWLPKFCGNILTDSVEEIFNNITRMSIIEDMSKGKFTHCNDHCPMLSNLLSGNDYHPLIVPSENYEASLSAFPFNIGFSYDSSCNLQCPSCRPGLQFTKMGENTTLDKIHAKVKELVYYLLNQNEQVLLQISGSSDPFASPTFWAYLQELSSLGFNENLKIELMTNGLLMNEEVWGKIKPLWKNICRIVVSTDAVSQETYAIVRKNGHISRLKENLSLLNEKIRRGDFPNLYNWQTSFTVQKANYHEIKEYAQWQSSLDTLKNISFSMIAQWGHLNDEKFLEMSLDDSDVILLKQILSDDIFSNDSIVLGNLSTYR